MTLRIENGKGLQFIQHQFNMLYPYLKIEFISTVSPKETRYLPVQSLLKTSPGVEPISIDISSNKTVAAIEGELKVKANLTARIYRRFCNVWIATSLTSDWTLRQQNSEGKLLSELNSVAL